MFVSSASRWLRRRPLCLCASLENRSHIPKYRCSLRCSRCRQRCPRRKCRCSGFCSPTTVSGSILDKSLPSVDRRASSLAYETQQVKPAGAYRWELPEAPNKCFPMLSRAYLEIRLSSALMIRHLRHCGVLGVLSVRAAAPPTQGSRCMLLYQSIFAKMTTFALDNERSARGAHNSTQ